MCRTVLFKNLLNLVFVCFCCVSCEKNTLAQQEKRPEATNNPTDVWPKEDVFSQALKAANLKPDDSVRALKIYTDQASAPATYIVLPVQSQAKGFSPTFRGLLAAQFEQTLRSNNIDVTSQTEVTDVNGPFVRRFDEDVIQGLLNQYKQQKLLMLYLGHDQKNTLITLVVRDQNKTSEVHQTIELPDDFFQALETISKMLPVLIKDAGITNEHSAKTIDESSAVCPDNSWDLTLPETRKDNLRQACRALVAGTLMPIFNASSLLISPAKRTWLAKAYALAASDLPKSDSAKAIRTLSLLQLGVGKADDELPQLISSPDPVVSQVARLLLNNANKYKTTKTVTAELKKAVAKTLYDFQKKLPFKTQILFQERLNIEDPFAQVNYCGIAAQFPDQAQPLACPTKAGTQAVATLSSTDAEKILYQDWHLAAYYKNIFYYGRTLGMPEQAINTINSLPSDIATHPYIQQLQYVIKSSAEHGGSVEENLLYKRSIVLPFVQSTVNLQSYSPWLAGYSVSEHFNSNDNQTINSDKQIFEARNAEDSMVKILKADRFHNPLNSMPPELVKIFAKMREQKPGAHKNELFPLRSPIYDTPSEDELAKSIAEEPENMQARVSLAFRHLKEGKSLQDAVKIINTYPKTVDDRVKESHDLGAPAHAFFFSGEPDLAKHFYSRSLAVGTGSASEYLAAFRLKLMDGKLQDAIVAAANNLERYHSDFARRDLASSLFIDGKPELGWQVFLPRITNANTFQFWMAAFVAHRMEGKNLKQINDWITAQKLDKVQINDQDVSDFYLHLQAVIDRLPSENDIDLLARVSTPQKYKNKMWEVSARLMQSALNRNGEKGAWQFAISNLYDDANRRNHFILPLYTWVAWQATEGKDENLESVRQSDLHQEFDHVLAKSMMLALENQPAESLRYFTAARYAISALSERAIPAPYQFALGGYLMYKKTGNDAYRIGSLNLLHAYERGFPWYTWIYGMEAVFEKDKKKKEIAACKAQILDAQSYFLQVAKSEMGQLNCKSDKFQIRKP